MVLRGLAWSCVVVLRDACPAQPCVTEGYRFSRKLFEIFEIKFSKLQKLRLTHACKTTINSNSAKVQLQVVPSTATTTMGEDKGEELMIQADKRLKGGFSFFGGTQKFEDAVELYTKAGNSFKIGKKCMLLSLSALEHKHTYKRQIDIQNTKYCLCYMIDH